jgi:hypothetical protein
MFLDRRLHGVEHRPPLTGRVQSLPLASVPGDNSRRTPAASGRHRPGGIPTGKQSSAWYRRVEKINDRGALGVFSIFVPSGCPIQNLLETRHADLAFQALSLQAQGAAPAAQPVVAPAFVV